MRQKCEHWREQKEDIVNKKTGGENYGNDYGNTIGTQKKGRRT